MFPGTMKLVVQSLTRHSNLQDIVKPDESPKFLLVEISVDRLHRLASANRLLA